MELLGGSGVNWEHGGRDWPNIIGRTLAPLSLVKEVRIEGNVEIRVHGKSGWSPGNSCYTGPIFCWKIKWAYLLRGQQWERAGLCWKPWREQWRFAECRILGWLLFFSLHYACPPSAFWPPVFSDETLAVTLIEDPCMGCVASALVLSRLSFSNLIIMCLEFALFGFCWASWNCKCMLVIKFVSLNILSALFFSCWDVHYICVLALLIVSHGPLRLFIFSFLFSLVFHTW